MPLSLTFLTYGHRPPRGTPHQNTDSSSPPHHPSYNQSHHRHQTCTTLDTARLDLWVKDKDVKHMLHVRYWQNYQSNMNMLKSNDLTVSRKSHLYD